MRFDFLIPTVSILGLAACTGTEAPEGELPFEGEADDELGKADHSTVAFTEIQADVSNARRERGGTVIITSKSAWNRVMGTPSPSDVDFSKEWVAFYGTGLKNTGGFGADITGIRMHAGIGAIVLETKATSPGFDCIVTQAFTTPHTVVKFAIPSPRPHFAFTDNTSEVKKCSPSNAEHLESLADSLAKWNAAKAANGNSYTYTREFASFTGFQGQTALVVVNGVVTERFYKAGHVDGTNLTSWHEVGAEVGSHTDEGFPAILVDALYEDCRTKVLTQDENKNFMNFSVDERGLLQVCTFTPMACQDDCSRGPVINTLVF